MGLNLWSSCFSLPECWSYPCVRSWSLEVCLLPEVPEPSGLTEPLGCISPGRQQPQDPRAGQGDVAGKGCQGCPIPLCSVTASQEQNQWPRANHCSSSARCCASFYFLRHTSRLLTQGVWHLRAKSPQRWRGAGQDGVDRGPDV